MTITAVPAVDVDTTSAGIAAGSTADRLGAAWREMRRGTATSAAIEQVFGRVGDAGAVEPGQLDVLDLLSARDGQRMSDLALALRVDPSTITRTMHRMEAAGLAVRAAAPTDGRVVTAHLTDHGRRVHAAAASRRTALIEAGFRGFTPQDRELLVDLLERFLRGLATHAGPDGSAPDMVG